MTIQTKATHAAACGAAVALALTAAGPARAQSQADMQRQLERLTREIETLKAQMQRTQQDVAAQAQKAPDTSSNFELSWAPGIEMKSKDGNFNAHIGGRIQTDAAIYDQDRSRLGDGTEIRRATVRLEGTFLKDWKYRFEPDFGGGAANSVSITDAWIGYTGLKPFAFYVGNLQEPFSMEDITSSRFLTFMERGLPNVFAAGYRMGGMVSANGANWSATGGLFGSTFSADPGAEGDEGYDLTGRVHFAPLYGKTQSVHLGFGARYNDPNNESLAYSQRPESHVTGARFVNTGTLANTEHQFQIGPELAAVWGPFSLQGEYIRTMVSRNNGSPDVDFDGWYVYGSWFITGESRNYEAASGTFGRIRPNANVGQGGFGAWEVALRYSGLDLTDGPVKGGTEKNLTFALNWYPNPYTRLMFNYILVNNDNNATGNAANLLPGKVGAGNDDPQVFQVRAQVDF
jgi:phosphate-selective porin OprO/OprP